MENHAYNENLSKKELRDLRYHGKLEKRERLAGRSRARRYIIWGGVAVILVLAVWGAIVVSPENITPSRIGKPEPINGNDWTRGNSGAKVSIIEYSDFQCPACAVFSVYADKLILNYGDKIQFAYRHFPLISIHKTSVAAAVAAEAAGKQGKFWEMVDKLFQNQLSWSDKPNVRDILIEYAVDLSLDLQRFTIDIDSKDLQNKINEAYKNATAMGLNYTPSVFINGELIRNPASYEEFKTIIESAIETNP